MSKIVLDLRETKEGSQKLKLVRYLATYRQYIQAVHTFSGLIQTFLFTINFHDFTTNIGIKLQIQVIREAIFRKIYVQKHGVIHRIKACKLQISDLWAKQMPEHYLVLINAGQTACSREYISESVGYLYKARNFFRIWIIYKKKTNVGMSDLLNIYEQCKFKSKITFTSEGCLSYIRRQDSKEILLTLIIVALLTTNCGRHGYDFWPCKRICERLLH